MKLATKTLILALIFCMAGCDEEAEKKMATQKEAKIENPEVTLVSMAGWTQTADTMGSIEPVSYTHLTLPTN